MRTHPQMAQGDADELRALSTEVATAVTGVASVGLGLRWVCLTLIGCTRILANTLLDLEVALRDGRPS